MWKDDESTAILDQLAQAKDGQGRWRLEAMIKASSFMRNDKYKYANIEFRFQGCRKANGVQIRLNEFDLYDVTFWKINKFDCEPTYQTANLMAEDLKELFEEVTGLALEL